MSWSSSNGILGWKTQNISACLPPMVICCWACRKCQRQRLFPLLEDSLNAKHWAVHGWYFAISISSFHILIWNISIKYSSFQLGEATFPLDDQDPFLDVLWYETVGKMKNLSGTARKINLWLAFQIPQTILVQSWFKKVGENLGQTRQYWSKWCTNDIST